MPLPQCIRKAWEQIANKLNDLMVDLERRFDETRKQEGLPKAVSKFSAAIIALYQMVEHHRSIRPYFDEDDETLIPKFEAWNNATHDLAVAEMNRITLMQTILDPNHLISNVIAGSSENPEEFLRTVKERLGGEPEQQARQEEDPFTRMMREAGRTNFGTRKKGEA